MYVLGSFLHRVRERYQFNVIVVVYLLQLTTVFKLDTSVYQEMKRIQKKEREQQLAYLYN